MTACQQRAKINMMYNDKTSHRNAERRKKNYEKKEKCSPSEYPAIQKKVINEPMAKYCLTHSSTLSTPPMSIQSAQLTRLSARTEQSMSVVGPHEATTMPLGPAELHLQHFVDEYASRRLSIVFCSVAWISGRPVRRCMPGGSVVRGTCGARADVRVQCTEKRSESAACGDGRGRISGASTGRSE